LEQGRVGVALVPVIEYQRLSGITVVPDICIGSRERVRSVVLVTSVDDLKSIHTVALDESSRTSAALVRIIFREFLGFEPQWSCSAPNLKQMLSENDAALIIGDPAMTFTRAGGLRVFDMAGLWREYTGLGFVFALWMIRDDASAADHQIDFQAACDEGLLKAEEIIDFYQPLLDLPRTELQTYLHENISFYMDAGMRAGLDLYYELAHKHGLIPAVKPLKSIDA
jgi:chorismate dehydratase